MLVYTTKTMARQPESEIGLIAPGMTEDFPLEELSAHVVLASLTNTECKPPVDPEMQKYLDFLLEAFKRTKLFNELFPETQNYLLTELGKLLERIKNKLRTPRNSGINSRTIKKEFEDEYEQIFNTIKNQTTTSGEAIHGSKVGILLNTVFNNFSQFLVAGRILSKKEQEAYRKKAQRSPIISSGEKRTTKTTRHHTPARRSGKQVF